MRDVGIIARPPATEADVVAFERRHGIELPQAYRRFVLEVGNGASSTDRIYDLLPLGELPSGFHARAEDHFARLCREFPHRSRWPYDRSRDRGAWRAMWDGCLPVGFDGAEVWVVVVTGGARRGQVWRLGPLGAVPNDPPRDFIEWYELWLDGGSDDWCEGHASIGTSTNSAMGGTPDRDAETNLPTARSQADPLQAQRDALLRALGFAERAAERALSALPANLDPSLEGYARFVRATAATTSGRADAEQLTLAIAREWLAPPTLGSVSQSILKSQLLDLLARHDGPAVAAIASEVRTAPIPEVILPEGDFF